MFGVRVLLWQHELLTQIHENLNFKKKKKNASDIAQLFNLNVQINLPIEYQIHYGGGNDFCTKNRNNNYTLHFLEYNYSVNIN